MTQSKMPKKDKHTNCQRETVKVCLEKKNRLEGIACKAISRAYTYTALYLMGYNPSPKRADMKSSP